MDKNPSESRYFTQEQGFLLYEPVVLVGACYDFIKKSRAILHGRSNDQDSEGYWLSEGEVKV